MIPIDTLVTIVQNDLDVETATVEAALLKNTTEYSPDAVAHNFVSDVLDGGATGAEFDGTNYTPGFGNSGRQSVANVAVTADDTDEEAVIDWDDVTWPSLGQATGGQVVEAVLFYVAGTDDTDSRILKIVDDSETAELEKQTNGEDFTWSTAAEGAINLTPQ